LSLFESCFRRPVHEFADGAGGVARETSSYGNALTHSDYDCVLAIMAKAPRAGHVKTRLSSVYPPALVVQLYRALIEDSIALARTVGVSIAAVCPADDAEKIAAWLPSDVRVVPQRGQGLAAGLSSVFERLCEPPRRVIAFNGDSPHLPPAVLESAFAALADHDLVFGRVTMAGITWWVPPEHMPPEHMPGCSIRTRWEPDPRSTRSSRSPTDSACRQPSLRSTTTWMCPRISRASPMSC